MLKIDSDIFYYILKRKKRIFYMKNLRECLMLEGNIEKLENYTIEWADQYGHSIYQGTIKAGTKKFRNIDSCAKFFNSKGSEWKNTGHKYMNVFMKITSEAENKSIVIKIYWNLYNGHQGINITEGGPLNKFPSEVCKKIYDMFGDKFGHYLNQGLSEVNILDSCCK